MISDVAILYVDPRGPYPKLAEHWWDEKRDARTYKGPWPVVAHPPCGPWGCLKHLWKGGGKDLAPLAVEQVRTWGGVLEHPAHSELFAHCGLPIPGELPDAWGGRTVAVNQVDWGHVARKPTWIYIVGSPGHLTFPGPGRVTHWVGGSRGPGRDGRARGLIPEGIKACSAQQRRRTPVAFAEWLISLAQQASKGTKDGQVLKRRG